MDLCDQSTSGDKAKMEKFYLHNMALTNLNVWDLNAKLGDLQLNGHGIMDEPWRIEGSRNEKIVNKRVEWTIYDKIWAIRSYGTHQHTQLACQWPSDHPKYLSN